MKKLLFLFLFFSITCFVYSQTNLDDFIGYWESEETSTKMIIWKDKFGNPQVVQFDSYDGDIPQILGCWGEKNTLYINHYYPDKDWKCYGSYTILNNRYIKCNLQNNNGETTLFYSKIK